MIAAVAATFACVVGWAAALWIMWYANPAMAKYLNAKSLITVVCSMAPALLAPLVHAPGAVGIVASALVALMALHAEPPAKASK